MSPTVEQLLRNARDALGGSVDSGRDAQVLLGWVLARSRAWLYAHGDAPVAGPEDARFAAALARRVRGEPIAHIVGRREFYGLDLEVTAATLIPRPDTETLVERALRVMPAASEVRVADLGTGSGAVALALAQTCPRAGVVATDRGRDALAVAQRNARRLGIGNVQFRHGDWFAALHDLPPFDVIVSNPPYVAQDDDHLDRGDVRFEPRTALVAGTDGLEAIRHLVGHAAGWLKPGGWLLLEHGYDQADAVRELFAAAGFRDCCSSADLAGRPRVTEGRLV